MLPVRIDCECEHCTELQTFCDDPIATEHQFAVRQELRTHLRLTIKRHRMDLRCRELKRGRPYRLVCIKTRASHERRLERYGKEIEAMRRLAELAWQGEEIVICSAGKPWLNLTPYRRRLEERQMGGFEGQFWMSDDFDEEDEELIGLIEDSEIFPNED